MQVRPIGVENIQQTEGLSTSQTLMASASVLASGVGAVALVNAGLKFIPPVHPALFLLRGDLIVGLYAISLIAEYQFGQYDSSFHAWLDEHGNLSSILFKLPARSARNVAQSLYGLMTTAKEAAADPRHAPIVDPEKGRFS